MIDLVLRSFSCPAITFLYNTALDAYGFRNQVTTSFPKTAFTFVPIRFQTRGPAETLYVGLKGIDHQGQILVLDNDNVYDGLDLHALPPGNFLAYNENPSGLGHYSFVRLAGDSGSGGDRVAGVGPGSAGGDGAGLGPRPASHGPAVLEVAERRRISGNVGMGGFGFESISVCREFCRQVIMSDSTEPYLSAVFSLMLASGLPVLGHHLPRSFSIGTEKDVILSSAKLQKTKLRVVFDLDNTLVSYPTAKLPSGIKDYGHVEPIPHMVAFAKYLKENGHEVIIYTARNTVTCGHNVGKVLKNVGLMTMQSLSDLGIEYDEASPICRGLLLSPRPLRAPTCRLLRGRG